MRARSNAITSRPVDFPSSSGGTSSEDLETSALMQKRKEALLIDEASKLDAEEESSVLGDIAGSDFSESAKEYISEPIDKILQPVTEIENKILQPFGEDGPSLEISKNKASVDYKVPGTGFAFPPPDGEWEGASLDITIPTQVPGLFIKLTGGLSGGVKVPELGMKLNYAKEKFGEDDKNTRIKVSFELANSDVLEATFGASIRVGVLGGIPMVASLEAGVEAASEAKMEIVPNISGEAEYLYDENSNDMLKPTYSHSEVSASLGAEAGLNASLALYVAGQLFVVKGDLYKLTLVSKDIASVKTGAMITRSWESGGKGETSIEPIFDKYFVAESWFKDVFSGNKLDKAAEKHEFAQYDVYALEDINEFLNADDQTSPMINHPSAAMRKLILEIKQGNESYIKKMTQKNDIELLEKTLENLAKKGQLEKDMEVLEGTLGKANKKLTSLHKKWAKKSTSKKVTKSLKKARKNLRKIKCKNSTLMNKKLNALEKEYGPMKEELNNQSKELEDESRKLNDSLANTENGGSIIEMRKRLEEIGKEQLIITTKVAENLRNYSKKKLSIESLVKVHQRVMPGQ